MAVDEGEQLGMSRGRAEAEGLLLDPGRARGPALDPHSVEGANHPGTVLARRAVHVDRGLRVAEDREDLTDLGAVGRRVRAHREPEVGDAARLAYLELVAGVSAPEVD